MKNLINIAKNICTNAINYVVLGLLFLMPLACIENDSEFFEMEGFIVGFHPCSINHSYRIGYVVISNDFSDTITTFNLSPREFTMPTPVGLNPKKPIFTIPEDNFRYYRGSSYLAEFIDYPDSLIKNYPIKIVYRNAFEHEWPSMICNDDIFPGDFGRQWINNHVVVVRASKN